MTIPEMSSTAFPKVEEDSDEKDNGKEAAAIVSPKGSPKAGSDWGVGFDFDIDGWMKKYVSWTYKQPMKSRCIVSAITASIGVLLARLTTTRTGPVRTYQQKTIHKNIDLLELASFAVHGGFVAGPLSYYM